MSSQSRADRTTSRDAGGAAPGAARADERFARATPRTLHSKPSVLEAWRWNNPDWGTVAPDYFCPAALVQGYFEWNWSSLRNDNAWKPSYAYVPSNTDVWFDPDIVFGDRVRIASIPDMWYRVQWMEHIHPDTDQTEMRLTLSLYSWNLPVDIMTQRAQVSKIDELQLRKVRQCPYPSR